MATTLGPGTSSVNPERLPDQGLQPLAPGRRGASALGGTRQHMAQELAAALAVVSRPGRDRPLPGIQHAAEPNPFTL